MGIDTPSRRELMLDAACLATAVAAGTLAMPVAATSHTYARSLLIDTEGDPLPASRLKTGEPMLFNYPFVASPVFLLRLDRAVRASQLATKENQAYAAPTGVGPDRAIVAFSAICAHKLMYPTAQVSFIGLRKGMSGEPAQVIHCCGDQSRYDPAEGARVLGGPAPQPLAAVTLEWDAASDRLHAVGTQGGEMFQAFFERYATKLELELGPKARDRAGERVVAKSAAQYSRQWQRCGA